VSNATKAQFKRAGIPQLPIRIAASQEPKTATDVILRKTSSGIDALINQRWSWASTLEISNKIACYAYWFHQTPDLVRQIVVNASDGDHPTLADYKFSATSPNYTLLPDPHFFRDFGYAETDQFAKEHAAAWNDRSDDIIWRGQANGKGLFTLDDDTVTKPGVIQRLHMAKKCEPLGVDFKFIAKDILTETSVLQDAGLIGGFIPTHDWGSMKYAIDIDGQTNAWCNLMQRLKLGCCVLKVDSPFGFTQWYYDQIKPWEHFVPVRADLSDLAAQVDWLRSNANDARDIAQNGQAFARQLTFESETQYARIAIEDRESSS
jgi:hypothetical protein